MTEPISSRKRSRNNFDNDNSTVGISCIDRTTPPNEDFRWWERAVAWIQGSVALHETEGFVHDAIRISDQREPCLNQSVEAGTVLFRIPPRCLICWANIAQDIEFGKPLVDTIMEHYDRVDDKSNNGDTKNSSPAKKSFFNSPYDLAIATFLAGHPEKAHHYQRTLPDSSAFDALPRRWTNKECRDYLTGSPLLARVIEERDGARNDYDRLQSAWETKRNSSKDGNHGETSTAPAFPSFEAFSDGLAAVTSRAFAGFGMVHSKMSNENSARRPHKKHPDEDIAMVPLLDLCDHTRGAKNCTKNLSYELTDDGFILVKAIQNIAKGESLRITYGARANGILLLNYGFCIPNNIEPDGSSNDTFEFRIYESDDAICNPDTSQDSDSDCIGRKGKLPDREVAVHLRQGPKSLAFHGFINALDRCRRAPPVATRKQHDLFADDCSIPAEFDEESEGDESFDWTAAMTCGGAEGKSGEYHDDYDDGDEKDQDTPLKNDNEAVIAELNTIGNFEKQLLAYLGRYSFTQDTLKNVLSQKSISKHYFAAILLYSEQQIIYFQLRVLGKLKRFLGDKIREEVQTTPAELANDMLDKQAESIANAFIAIRFPGRGR